MIYDSDNLNQRRTYFAQISRSQPYPHKIVTYAKALLLNPHAYLQ